MKWIAVVAMCLTLASCAVSPAFLEGVEAQWAEVRPRYVDYVQADTDLSPLDKAVRMANVATMDLLIRKERERWPAE